MNLNYRSLGWRLVLIGLFTVILQVAAVSQVKVFGVNADLVPLVAASVGLICGALPGAVFGFALGLLLDFALVETVGVASLILLTIGYATGRLRELRDPQGAIVPLLVGAAATAAGSWRRQATTLRRNSKQRASSRAVRTTAGFSPLRSSPGSPW